MVGWLLEVRGGFRSASVILYRLFFLLMAMESCFLALNNNEEIPDGVQNDR